MTNHTHLWYCLRDTLVICEKDNCNTIMEIRDLVTQTEETAKIDTKIEVLAAQIFKNELKKPARADAAAWIRQHSAGVLENKQVRIL